MTDRKLPRRPLGATGLQVSPLGLAGMAVRFGGPAAPGLKPDDVERAYHEHGVNTFLAHHRMGAICEGVRRLVKAGHRDDLVLASELSLPFGGSARRGLDKHLRVLGVDHLDLWLVGWVRWRWYLRPAVWDELLRLKQSGRVRALGFSCHDRKLATAIARELPIDVLMIRYNAAHRGAEREVFEPLRELGDRRPGIVAYTATRWGMLLSPLPKSGFEQGMSGPECYRFVLGHDMVDTVWCAPRSTDELREDAAGALAGPLEQGRYAEVRAFGDAVHAAARGGKRWMFGASAH